MKLFFAPDTSDHSNWGCRVMGWWYRHAFAREGIPPAWRRYSKSFSRRIPDFEELESFADIRKCASEIRAGRILPRLAAALRDADMVFFNGENFIRPHARKGRTLLMLAYVAKTVFNKPCVLSNHSVDLGEPRLEEIVREVYPLLDEVHFREATSLRLAGRYVAEGRSRLIPDVAWDAPPEPLEKWISRAGRVPAFDPGRPYITVCASSVFGLRRYSRLDAAPAFTELCRQLNERVAPVVLTAPCDPDVKIMDKVQESLGLPMLHNKFPLRLAVNIIGNAAVHVGGRWHPAIFATGGGTPCVSFSANTHKVASLVEQVGQDGPIFDVLRLDEHVDEVVAAAKQCVEAGPQLRAKLLQRARELRAEVGRGLECLRSRLAN